ncbi:MAG: hypothetical protein K2J78_03420, partial [Muribaculaceae bacterium]|nr:hypothetical protein [Muribaculaceae bacterium]
MTQTDNAGRLQELGSGKIWKLLLKYSLPAVVGTVVSAVYNIIDQSLIHIRRCRRLNRCRSRWTP